MRQSIGSRLSAFLACTLTLSGCESAATKSGDTEAGWRLGGHRDPQANRARSFPHSFRRSTKRW